MEATIIELVEDYYTNNRYTLEEIADDLAKTIGRLQEMREQLIEKIKGEQGE